MKMTKERYETLPLSELKAIAKARGLKKCSTLKKAELIDRMLEEDRRLEEAEAAGKAEEAVEAAESVQAAEPLKAEKPEKSEEPAGAEEPAKTEEPAGTEKPARRRGRPPKKAAETPEKAGEDQTPKAPAKRGRKKKADKAAPSQAEETVAPKAEAEPKSEPEETQKPAAGTAPKAEAEAASAASVKAEEPAKTPAAQSEADKPASEASDQKPVREGDRPSPSPNPQKEQRKVRGILEVMPDGYGFLRVHNYMPSEEDVYVSPAQIRRFGLKTGDMLTGPVRPRNQGEKFGALTFLETINDMAPDEAKKRTVFENMTPTFPCERIPLERPDGAIATRIVDLISPIGKGQRGMIVSPPKAGKTTLLKDIARSILRRNEEAHLMILLIDERPEEVTDMKESVSGKNVEIIYSTFDEMPEHHKRVSEMAIERAKRLVEHKKDVIILLDSITRLARAYNVLVPPSGRTLSGGLDPTALYMPKRFFGAARNMREGGSLTILATALVDTGSKMDDVVYEEFKGTGNMELILDRKLQERRIFPAIDIVRSGTRREDLLLTKLELEAVNRMRRSMNGMKSEAAVEAILRAFAMTRTNADVVKAALTGRLA